MTDENDMLVIGLGVSGLAAARLLLDAGRSVTVVDGSVNERLKERGRELEAMGARVELGAVNLPKGRYAGAVISPGVPPENALVRQAVEYAEETLSELELGFRHTRARLLAVTGSNGKSTVVKWMAEWMRREGLHALPGGNYGTPLCELVCESPYADWYIVEASSFQLERVSRFRADIGILLNIQPNHLDRHRTMECYTETKRRLFDASQPDDLCVVPDEWLETMRRGGGRGQWVRFGASPSAEYSYRNGVVYRGNQPYANVRATLFGNDIMGPSAAAVAAAADRMGLDPAYMRRSLDEFKPLSHRMECVGRVRGVRYVNDSKATSLSAMSAGLRMTDAPVRLIAGGRCKERDLRVARETLRERAVAVYLIGESQEALFEAWKDAVPCIRCGTMDEALRRLAEESVPGDTVLLSPGCASFDQYRDFAERGDCFVEWVKKLAESE